MAIRIIELSKLNSETRNSELKTLMLRAGKDISDVSETSKQIIDDVKARGDEALFDYEKRFTAVELSAETIRVTKEEIAEAYSKINKRLLKAIKHAAKNIEKFHRKCLPGEFEMKIEKGVKAGRLIRPVGRAGLYIPGGKAVYPSVMLMLSIPAKVAGVNEIVACTPLQKGANSLDVATLVAADIGGVSEIYKVGGAQAIAALAYGTKTIKRTDVIAGPGNPYVSAAQKLVRNDVRIDF
ncbi:histidinol dehydrogenase, partial [Candidatus Micrarchaeota archaeon CG06_land_8_20_14_3_00_50_6]